MNKFKVEITGYGQKNGPKRIDISFDINKNEVGNYQSNNRYDYISKAISFHYPDYTFDPKNVSIKVTEIKQEKIVNSNVSSAIGGFILGKLTNHEHNVETKVRKPRKQTVQAKNSSTLLSFSSDLVPLNRLEFPEDTDGITKSLDEIYFAIKNHKWNFTNDEIDKAINRENNNALDFCLFNYKKGFKKLKKTATDIELLKQYKSKLNKLILKKYINLYGFIVFVVILFITIILYLWANE